MSPIRPVVRNITLWICHSNDAVKWTSIWRSKVELNLLLQLVSLLSLSSTAWYCPHEELLPEWKSILIRSSSYKAKKNHERSKNHVQKKMRSEIFEVIFVSYENKLRKLSISLARFSLVWSDEVQFIFFSFFLFFRNDNVLRLLFWKLNSNCYAGFPYNIHNYLLFNIFQYSLILNFSWCIVARRSKELFRRPRSTSGGCASRGITSGSTSEMIVGWLRS